MNTRLTALACLAVVLGPLAACDEPQQSSTRSYDVTGSVASLAVNSLGGRITVTAGPGGTVHVTETLRYTGPAPDPRHDLAGDGLTLTSGCQGHGGNCGVDYRVEVPAATLATLDSAGGAIAVTGLSGELHLTSGGGAVDADALTPGTVTARTGGGAVRLTFTKAPGTVRVDSGGGDVTVRVPRDSYSVDAQGDGGPTSVGMTSDPSATHRLGLHSGGGSITVTTAA